MFIGIEAAEHCWMIYFSHLAPEGFKIAVINPIQVKVVRKLQGYSHVKNDHIDSQTIIETMRISGFDETRLTTDELQPLKTLTCYR
jgi:transposase